jgi:hypothetical protein
MYDERYHNLLFIQIFFSSIDLFFNLTQERVFHHNKISGLVNSIKYFICTVDFYIDSITLASYIMIHSSQDYLLSEMVKISGHYSEHSDMHNVKIAIFIILGIKTLQMFGKISNGFNYVYKVNRSLLDGRNLMYYFELLITIIRLIVL